MKAHLDTHGADGDMRNPSLYALRNKIRTIEKADSVDRIEDHVLEAEEAFEIFWSEVAGK